MQAEIRPARTADIDSLVTIENASFPTDRISRRSFRQMIEHETAAVTVAEHDGAILGYCVVLFRKASGVARLYSLASDPRGRLRGTGRALLDAAERIAYDRGRLLLRLEVREDNARAVALYGRNGYRPIGSEPDYYEDGATALRFEKLLRGDLSAPTVPYYEQTEDFTCGPCCLMMARAHFDPGFKPEPVLEIRLWREATTIFMMSGPGGCEPFGMAVAAVENGLSAEIFVSRKGPLFLESVRSEEKRRVMKLAQTDFHRRAREHGIRVHARAFAIDDIRRAVRAGRLVAVLVTGFVMFGKKVPHWVLVIADDGSHLVVHDPWVEEEKGETAADAAGIPIAYQLFNGMARFGRPGLRAAVVLGPGEPR